MNRITLEDIAGLLSMSPSSASRYFKYKTRFNFGEYLTNCRIDHVIRLYCLMFLDKLVRGAAEFFLES